MKNKPRARKMWANYHAEGYVFLYSIKSHCMNSAAEHIAVPVAVIPLDDPMIVPALAALGIRLGKGGRQMSTPTPRTDAVYLEHRHWANEDEATEAIEDFRDLARTLERELAAERQKVRALTAILESICEEWGRNHDANPIGAGQKMETLASKALEDMEGAQ